MAYLGYLVESYQSFSIGQKRTISIYCIPDQLEMDYDPNLIQRILENLISNSLKFTNVYGQIKVLATEKDNSLCIKVIDNGKGISEDELPYIFDRFYQADDTMTRGSEGTGIGLSLVKEIVHLLEGHIEAESIIDEGTTISITLPRRQEHRENTISEDDLRSIIDHDLRLSTSDLSESEGQSFIPALNNDDRPLLLIIEDNIDVINYLKSCLKDNYFYLFGRDGKIGVELALEHIPDIIISDLMMPEFDGFHVCETLKNDQRTSHIPIIILTAKATVEDRLAGLQKGADAYLSKPFNEDELLIRLEKLVQVSRALQNRLSDLELEEADEQSAFLKKTKSIIHQNLDNDTFQVTNLCFELGMSRTQLHRKIKALTGFSTAQFMRKVKLKEAKHLLETSDLNVSEVAYRVGFRHHTNFTIAYKNEFGSLPVRDMKLSQS